ncbi:MAG: hypothetical protein LBP75_08525 [Planctomycetota bacterium]|nr:hypothetical protein [Planctomycetota bacterium]
MQKDDLSIGIRYAGGGELYGGFHEMLEQIISRTKLSAVAFILDRDKETPMKIIKRLQKEYGDILCFNGANVYSKTPTDIYILPDNNHQGTLDSLLCKCGKVVYPALLEFADKFLCETETQKEKIEKWGGFRNFDRDKAMVAAAASVLKPGKTNRVSVLDDLWVSDKSKNTLKCFTDFLQQWLVKASSH